MTKYFKTNSAHLSLEFSAYLLSEACFDVPKISVAIIPAISLLAFYSGRAIRRYSKKAQSYVAESNTIVE